MTPNILTAPRSSSTRVARAHFHLMPAHPRAGPRRPAQLRGQGPCGAASPPSRSPGSSRLGRIQRRPVPQRARVGRDCQTSCRRLSAGLRDCSNLFQGFELASLFGFFLIIGDTLQQKNKQTNKINPSASQMDVLAIGQL